MLKITESGRANGALTLRLEGSIGGPWVQEIQQVCESHLRSGCELRLDLSEVAFVEPAGLRLLFSLQARGVALVDCSLFVAEQLKAGPA